MKWTEDQTPDEAALARFIDDHPRLVLLTGAGVSTESGIPDYRDTRGEWKRPPPVTFQAFMGDEAVRRRYWARSMIGWRIMGQAEPGLAHRSLVALEEAGHVALLITQNVDGLHQRAGSRAVVDLHGRIDTVRCMGCEARSARAALQQALLDLNPRWAALHASAAPDGDADLDGLDFSSFAVPPCPRCGGLLKPDVVFFGENVPRPRVDQALAAVRGADALLVIGSSLMVYSGFRFVQAAVDAGRPVAALNQGRTRGDALFTLKVERPIGATLGALAARAPRAAVVNSAAASAVPAAPPRP